MKVWKAGLAFVVVLSLACLVTLNQEKMTRVYLTSSRSAGPFSSNNKRLIMVLFGTRPEAIKLAPLIRELTNSPNEFSLVLVSTGQHQHILRQVLDTFKLENSIDFALEPMKDLTLSQMTSQLVSKIDVLLNKVQPWMVIVQGDTTSAYAAALASFYRQIPVGHVEAGLRTRNMYSPFPEEVNRQSIGIVASLHFAATEWSKKNLLAESKDPSRVFLTGNTVIDALKLVLKTEVPDYVKTLVSRAANKVLKGPSASKAKVTLLTIHRRESYMGPIQQIFKAVYTLLKKFPELVLIYPVHPNPNVRNALEHSMPQDVYLRLRQGLPILEPEYEHMNRLMMIEPLEYTSAVHLLNVCHMVMTDSGGIQEEAVGLGKPVFVLRDNTERPEGVHVGTAVLAGTTEASVIHSVSKVIESDEEYNRMSVKSDVYGSGDASIKIVSVIRKFFNSNLKPLSQEEAPNPDSPTPAEDGSFDVLIVLTVWKRETLDRQLKMLFKQSMFQIGKRINIVVFQNGQYVDVSHILDKWKDEFAGLGVTLDYMQSIMQTGYFGRFLVPLVRQVSGDSTFFVLDDDIIIGKKYLENMQRVIDEGYFSTRNGRLLDSGFVELLVPGDGFNTEVHVYNEDSEFDFGGHVWGGKIDWLRKAWNHPPPTIITGEDFWISAVLKVFYGIGTMKPSCSKESFPDTCACSMGIAVDHRAPEVGASSQKDNRLEAMKLIATTYKYKRLQEHQPNIDGQIRRGHVYEKGNNTLLEDLFHDCLYWE